jgi:hypothetical protein
MLDIDNKDCDTEVKDSALLQEIELLGELIAAVAAAGRRLCQSEIDAALDVTQPRAAA